MYLYSSGTPVEGFSSCAKSKFEEGKLKGQYPCLNDYPEKVFNYYTKRNKRPGVIPNKTVNEMFERFLLEQKRF